MSLLHHQVLHRDAQGGILVGYKKQRIENRELREPIVFETTGELIVRSQ